MLLRCEGHDVRIAHDGPSALDLANEFTPTAQVLDIGLPRWMDINSRASFVRASTGGGFFCSL